MRDLSLVTSHNIGGRSVGSTPTVDFFWGVQALLELPAPLVVPIYSRVAQAVDLDSLDSVVHPLGKGEGAEKQRLGGPAVVHRQRIQAADPFARRRAVAGRDRPPPFAEAGHVLVILLYVPEAG